METKKKDPRKLKATYREEHQAACFLGKKSFRLPYLACGCSHRIDRSRTSDIYSGAGALSKRCNLEF